MFTRCHRDVPLTSKVPGRDAHCCVGHDSEGSKAWDLKEVSLDPLSPGMLLLDAETKSWKDSRVLQ